MRWPHCTTVWSFFPNPCSNLAWGPITEPFLFHDALIPNYKSQVWFGFFNRLILALFQVWVSAPKADVTLLYSFQSGGGSSSLLPFGFQAVHWKETERMLSCCGLKSNVIHMISTDQCERGSRAGEKKNEEIRRKKAWQRFWQHFWSRKSFCLICFNFPNTRHNMQIPTGGLLGTE